MPSYKNIGSFVRYHGLMAPSLRAAKKLMGFAARKGKAEITRRYPKLSKMLGEEAPQPAPKPTAQRARPKSKVVGAKVTSKYKSYKSSPPKYSKPAKARPAKTTKTVPKASQRPDFGSRVGSVESSVKSSRTAGQLRRKLGGMAARRVTQTVSKPGSTRKQAADAVRKFRRTHGARAQGALLQTYKYEYAKQAAKHLRG